METTLSCPKCQGAMEEGFIVDRAEGFYSPKWQHGSPQHSRFLGMTTDEVKTKVNEWRPVATYRCTQCGFLEAYAP